MEYIYNLIMEVIENFPWFVVLYTVRTVYKNRPKKTKLQYKEFLLESSR